MSTVFISTIIRQSLIELIITVGPILGVSLLLGLLISIFQAVTSIQEQTLTFVPKMIAILATLGLLGPWAGSRMIDYFVNMMGFISQV